MSDKPSLYVVEKKEVVILVILFVLVTVLSFTMGVRYGESVGKKSAKEQLAAEAEHGEVSQNSLGGTLGGEAAVGKSEEHTEAGEHEEVHGSEKHEKKESAHGAEDEHGKSAAHGKENNSPEVAAKSNSAPESKEMVDKSSDEYLLGALKDAGVEPPGGKAPKDAKLPQDVKEVRSGDFVIQVGSHPSRAEADSQVKALKAKKVNADVLAPFKDRQGEWHRVVVGSFKNKRDAEKEANRLKSKGAIVSFYVRRMP